MSWSWIVIIVLLILLCGTGKSRTTGKPGTRRIDHPHVIDRDDYECPACRRRFTDNVMVCPYCRTRFSGTVEDDREFTDEEEELEDWDEEDGY
jgi:ribosomal protein L37AE/L43A